MTQVGIVYGASLYDLAKAETLTDEIMRQMQVLQDAFSQEPAFLRLLSSANLAKQERCQVLDDSFRGKVHPYLLNFMKILVEKGYVRYYFDCCRAYRERYNDDHGILPVCAVSAVPLRDEQISKLENILGKMTGKTVQLENRTDPKCLGGVRLDYDGKRVDATVKTRISEVHAMLGNMML